MLFRLAGVIQFLLGMLYLIGGLIAPFGSRADHAPLALFVAALAMATSLPIMGGYQYPSRRVWWGWVSLHLLLVVGLIMLLMAIDHLALGHLAPVLVVMICFVGAISKRPAALASVFE